MRKVRERPEADERRVFSMIWGVKTTIQQAIDMELLWEGMLALWIFGGRRGRG